MGKVDCIVIQGLDLWFNSSDHLPPHFHVGKVGEYELRIYFLLCTDQHLEYDRKWGKEPTRKSLETLRDLAIQNRVALLDEWERKVCLQ